jgi:hypothetical protein
MGWSCVKVTARLALYFGFGAALGAFAASEATSWFALSILYPTTVVYAVGVVAAVRDTVVRARGRDVYVVFDGEPQFSDDGTVVREHPRFVGVETIAGEPVSVRWASRGNGTWRLGPVIAEEVQR